MPVSRTSVVSHGHGLPKPILVARRFAIVQGCVREGVQRLRARP